jgi:uncharacterized protein YndB with AHSA1/START domain
MTKHKFVTEFPFKTSPKIVFNYVNTAGGLQQWFATHVDLDSDRNFIFEWDGTKHKATKISRPGKSARYDFLDDDEGNSLEFKLILGELDGSTYLQITDISDNDDDEELQDLWDGLISDLKDIVGG